MENSEETDVGRGKKRSRSSPLGTGDQPDVQWGVQPDRFSEYVFPVRDFHPFGAPNKIATIVNEKYQFKLGFGDGKLGRLDITYFVPEDYTQFVDLMKWLGEETNLEMALRVHGFRKVDTYEYPVLVTERLKGNLISYIIENLAGKDSHEDGMTMITFISDIFNSLARANELNYTCRVENIFVGEDGSVRLPFILRSNADIENENLIGEKKAKLTGEKEILIGEKEKLSGEREKLLDEELEEILTVLVNEAYAGGGDQINSPDLKMLVTELFDRSDATDAETNVLNLFKWNKFPLADYDGLLDFLKSNTDFIKDVSNEDFGVHMHSLLGANFKPWEYKFLHMKKKKKLKHWGSVAQTYNKRRSIPQPDAIQTMLFDSSPKETKDYRNCPAHYVHLSRNADVHQNSLSDPYPASIRALSKEDLIKELCRHYPGVYTAFYLTYCRLEPKNVKLSKWGKKDKK